MKRTVFFVMLVVAILLSAATLARASGNAQILPFSQNWSNTGQITGDNNWNNVPGINGYLGGDISFTPGANPQSIVDDGAATGLNVRANQGNPNSLTTGGVAEFDRSPTTNPVVALQPTDSADLPHLVMSLDTRNKRNVNVSYLLRDIDGSSDNVAQQTVLQYRIGSSGTYTNLPAGYVADATTGPNLANKTTPVSVTLPAAAENQAVVQVRVGSANAAGTDEWVGVDDISVSSAPGVSISGLASPDEGTTQTYNYAVSDTDSGDAFTLKNDFPDCGTGGTFVSGSLQTGASGGSFQCRFPDGPASSNVRVQGTDSRGLDSNTASQAVTVQNVAPTLTLSGPTSANEGATQTYDYTVTDPGQDTFSVKSGFPDCGAGGASAGTPTKTATGGSFQCRFADGPASPSVRMQVADEDGADSNTATRSVSVANVAPTVTLNGPNAADEGQTKSYTYSVADPGDDSNPAITESCGQNGVKTDTPETNDFQCRFPDGPASSTVSVGANDGDASNNTGSASTTVQVANVAPGVTLSGPDSANEGTNQDYTFAVTDPGQDTFTVKSGFPDCGTGGTSVSGSQTTTASGGSFRCRFSDGPESPNVRLGIADSDGADSNAASRSVNVSNVVPTVTLSGPTTANEGETKAYDFTVADPGQDTFTVGSGFPNCGSGNQLVSGSLTTTTSGGSFRCRFADGPTSAAVKMQVADEDGGNSNVASRSVTVANVAPTVELSGPTAADEGQTKTYTYSVTDPGDDANPAIAESCGQNGVKVDTPETDNFRCRFPDGPASSTVSVTADDGDGDGADNIGGGSVAVQVANVAPTVTLDGPASADEGQTKTYAHTVNDPGADPNPSVTEDCGQNARKTEAQQEGSFDCTFPDGPASSTVGVTATDEDGGRGDASRRVEVSNVAPTAGDDPAEGSYETDEDESLNVGTDRGLLSNDADRGEDRLTARTVSDPERGTVQISGDGSFVYRPNDDYNGDDSFTYEACDEDGACSGPATVGVRISAVNDAPVNDVPGPQRTEEDTPLVFSAAEGNAISIADPDDGRLQTTITATGGTLERRDINGVAAAGDGEPAITVEGNPARVEEALDGLRFVPEADRNGEAGITVSTDDNGNTGSGGPLTDEDAVDITTEPVNDAPVAEADAYDAREDETLTVEAPGVLGNDSDVDRDALAATVAEDPARGDLEIAADGSFVYTPDRDFNGDDAFTYRAGDGNGGAATGRASITVGAANDAPVVDLNGGPEGTGYDATFTEDGGSVAAVDGSALTVTDVDDAEVRSATVTLQDRPDGDAETLAADASGTDVAASYDRQTGQLRLRGAAPKADYQRVLRTVAYENTSQDPAPADRSLRFVASDDEAESEAAISTIKIRAVNDAPEISNIPDAATDEDTPTDAVPFTVRDLDNPADELTLSGSSDDAELVPDAGVEFGGSGEARTVRVNPVADRFGTARITAAVSDGGTTATDAFTLTVRDKTPPDAPDVDLDAASDTGASDTDDVTNDSLPVFTGEAEAGSEVEIFDGDNGLRRVTAENGEWRYEVPAGAAFEDGEHRITATATDAAGNTSEASGPLNVTVDRREPDTDVDGSPHDPTNETTATFRFRADEENATFECFVDDFNFERCSSPMEYGDVSGGAHAFEVRATDLAGNTDPSPAMREWTVDRQAPDVSLTEPADDALVMGEVRIAADADDDRGLEKVEFLVDGEVVDVDRGAADDRDEPYEFGWDTTLEEDGEHEIVARATDAAGNVTRTDPRTVRVDNTAPDTNVDSSPASPTNAERISFAFSSPDGSVSFECSFNGRGFVPCESPKEYPDEDVSGLTEGDHLFKVRAVDEVGNPDDSPAERAVVIDTQSPEAPAVERPADGASDNDGALNFSGTAEPGSRVQIFEVSNGGAESRATARRTDENGDWSVGFSGVPDGEHTYVAVATDAAGNESGRSGGRTVTVDTAPPEVVNVIPHADQVDAPINTDVEVVFSKKIDEATLEGNFMLTRERDGETVMVPGRVTYDAATNSANLWPDGDLGYSEVYTATVRGGEGGIGDLAGNSLAADETWSFTTAEEPDMTAPDQPVIEQPAEDLHDDDGAFAISGTAEPESRVRVFEADSGEPISGAFADQDGAWSVDLADVPEGRHVYAATAADVSRNESGRSAGRTITVDLTAPDTLIDSSPASVTNNAAANFGFSSDEPGTTFECSVDGSRFGRCASPREYRDLAEGEHVFDVRAVDRAGNTDPSAARRSFVVDTTAPEASLTEPGENALVRGEVRLRAEATDDRGIKRVEFLVEGKVVDSDLQGPFEFGWDSTLMGDGDHAVGVRATDEAGNRTTSAATNIRVDNSAPDTRITRSPPLVINGEEAQRVEFAFSSEDAGGRFECRMDAGGYERNCTSPKTYENLSDGRHLFAVRAVDEAGNRDDTPAERRVEVDAAPPDARIDATPNGITRDRTARVEFSSEAGATFRCSLDGGAFGACSSPLALTDLSEGEHTFRVQARDAAGNTGPVVGSEPWTVDTTGPRVSINSGPSGTVRERSASFAFSSENGSTFQCRLDDGPFESCAAPKKYQDLSEGGHAFQVKATDAAGNTGAAVERSWTVEAAPAPGDTAAPRIVRMVPAKGAKSVFPRNAISATFSENMAPGTINVRTFKLIKRGTNRPVAATVSYSAGGRKATLRPRTGMSSKAYYSVVVIGGTNGVKDLAGNPLARNTAWAFRVR